MKRRPDDCSFRQPVPAHGPGTNGAADCGLLRSIAGAGAGNGTAAIPPVRRDACEACCDSFRPSADDLNPVVASLLYNIGHRLLESGAGGERGRARARALMSKAEHDLADRVTAPTASPCCDVVLCCVDDSEETDRAVRSLLEQDGAAAIVHLVDDGGGAGAILDRYAGRWNVVPHVNPARRSTFATLHALLPRLRSEYVAVQDPRSVSLPRRLRASLGLLEATGAELLAAALQTPTGVVRPIQPEPGAAYRRFVPPQTLVFRRASLIDMGGIAGRGRGPDGEDDDDAELVFRAAREGRKLALIREPTVAVAGDWAAGAVGPPPRYRAQRAVLRHHALGFPRETVECDVVLPFRGHLDYVRQALESLLAQEGAEAIVHLADDATPGGAEDLLRYWGTHPRVRTYRNTRNIGQFATFNNLFPYFETRLVAVQDADDVSLPNRLSVAGNLLRTADADIFGGRSRIFDDAAGFDPSDPSRTADGRWPEEWISRYPTIHERYCFLQNPTAMIRVSTFEAMRGFSDYGDPVLNKCGLDTEFYVRAAYAQHRFAVSREVLLGYRRHPDSATRNAETGWGTAARTWSEAENDQRFRFFSRGRFDPRVYGGLKNHWGITQRTKTQNKI